MRNGTSFLISVALLTLWSLGVRAGQVPEESALPELPKTRFVRKTRPAEAGADGVIHLSDGSAFGGRVSLTRDKPLELYDLKRKRWVRAVASQIRTLEFAIEKENVEREWRWKESGKDEKVYTGRQYVDRRYLATLTLRRGRRRHVGHILGTVIYVTDVAGNRRRYFLRKDQRGQPGQRPEQLVHVTRVDLRPGAMAAWRKTKQAEARRPLKGSPAAGRPVPLSPNKPGPPDPALRSPSQGSGSRPQAGQPAP